MAAAYKITILLKINDFYIFQNSYSVERFACGRHSYISK